ncbi:MAG: hypothetical protein IT229_10400 [Flavobacteriales bacterium]|nr:hypothetical protein [Flavobacteriales bacterium]
MSGRLFIIEDEFHAQQLARHMDKASALVDIKEWSTKPWDEAPNRCPCTSWRTCGRDYVIVEYNTAGRPWIEIARHHVLSISAKGSIWHEA